MEARRKPITVLRRASQIGLGLLVFLAPSIAVAETRKPNAFEVAYTAMALDFGASELCERISPNAESRLHFNSPGTQIYRERSRCFLYSAVSSLNPFLCRFVVEAAGWLHDGYYFSRENCESLVSEGKPFNFSLSFDRKRVLTKMGYSVAEIAETYPGDPEEVALHRFYLNAVGRDGDFQRRLQRLPDFAELEQ
ncbi:MAG: hypothetical protein JXR14_05185 [Paracoccaceae bacterium]